MVQRQLWLLNNIPRMTKAKAYDQARQEFYAVRHQEDVERRVAKEEALATGAYFGKSHIEIGMELEDQMFERWKQWATSQAENIQNARAAAYTALPGDEESEEDSNAVAARDVDDGEDDGEASKAE